MVVLGYIGALLMGLVLGLIGGGGSILTVPILHYLFGMEMRMATACSLFVVGATAAFGSTSHVRQGNVHWPSTLWFGAPSIVAVFATRAWLLPMLPEQIGPLTKDAALLILFTLLMLAAAIGMVRKRSTIAPPTARVRHAALLLSLLEGAGVGTLTGLVGAGGGFLIIPALVMFGGLGMKQAIGTSLVIIAAKSLIGFTGDLWSGLEVPWPFLLAVTAISVVGIIAGARLNARLSAERLKPAFGWFVLVMGTAMLLGEVLGR